MRLTDPPLRFITLKPCAECKLRTSAMVPPQERWEATRFDQNRSMNPEPRGAYREIRGNVCLLCRGCGKPKYAKAVRGKFNSKVACNHRCTAATGHDCECSCGGKNHGASFGFK